MISTKYIGMDVHKESISIAVLNVAVKSTHPSWQRRSVDRTWFGTTA
jgi:hypothetical protein